MAINEMYVLDLSLEPVFRDKETGLPLADGAIYFYEDNNRNQLKSVYQLTGSPPNYTYSVLPNPVPLSGAGMINDDSENNIAIYYYPYDEFGNVQLYYIEVYAAGSSPGNGTPQITREAWPNLQSSPSVTTVGVSNQQNILDNPQFVDVLFDPTQVLTVQFSGNSTTSVEIAPGWYLDIRHSGGGSLEVQRTAITGTQDIPTQPPYTLTVTPGFGIQSLELRQRLVNNPGIFAQIPSDDNGYVATSLTVGTGTNVNCIYRESNGNETNLLTANNATGAFQEYRNTVQLPVSTNATDADSGYVDFIIELENSGSSTITSAQIIGLQTNESSISFFQSSANRQRDQLFNFYNPRLSYKPIPSHLVGWDFSLNPAQILGESVAASAIGAEKSKYVWDQTILFQEIDSGVSVDRGSNGCLELTADLEGQMAIVQYIEVEKARELLNDSMSVNVAAYTSSSSNIRGNVSIWYTEDVSLPDVSAGNNDSLILTLDSDGKPFDYNGNWLEVPRSPLQDADFSLSQSATTNFNDYNFSGWNMNGAAVTNTATYMAIVIGFGDVPAGETISIHSVSLCSGNIATRPAPQSLSQVLEECERYYEKSYKSASLPGTTELDNALSHTQQSNYLASPGNYQMYQAGFGFQYRVAKRVDNPEVTLYSPSTGASGNVDGNSWGDGAPVIGVAANAIATYWGTSSISDKGASYQPSGSVGTTAGVGSTSGSGQGIGWIRYHYVVDARLGIV